MGYAPRGFAEPDTRENSMYRTLLATTALVALAAATLADVNIQAQNGDKIFGTFNPAGETETFRVHLPEGAKLTVIAKGKRTKERRDKPGVTLQLFAPESDTPIVTDRLKQTKGGAKLRGFEAPETGVYRVVLTGDGSTVGDYLCKLKWKSPKVYKINGDTTDDDIEVTFFADAGSTAKFLVKRAGGGKAVPRLDNVFAVEGDFDEDFEFPDNDRVTKHKGNFVLTDTGEYLLTVTDDGFDGGRTSGKIVVKQAKTKRKVELTTEKIGASKAGGDLAVGNVIGPDGGEIELFEFTEGALEEVILEVPEGALDLPTALIAGSASEVFAPPEQEDDLQGAGPSVFFGPEGTTFAVPVTVTIPFDPDAADDASEVRVVRRDGDGTTGIIDPDDGDVDTDNGTVSFPTSHFTAFRAFVPRRPAAIPGDVDRDGTPELFVRAPSAEIGDGAVHAFLSGQPISPGATTASAQFTLLPDAFSAELGTAIAFGDFDRDGDSEVAVGAPGAGDGGEVYVFNGGGNFLFDDTIDADVTVGGSTPSRLGTSLVVGDFNGDGTADLAMGAPETDAGAGLDQGAVYVFFGGSSFQSANASQADAVFTGAAGDDLFGTSLTALDYDGDGIDDLVVGAPQIEAGNGTVYLFRGSATFTGRSASAANSSVVGESLGDEFGATLAAGNVDGSPGDDLLVGAPGSAAGGSAGDDETGSVYVFSGGTTTLPTAITARARIDGVEGQDRFGAELQSADLDDDQNDEIVVGAPFAFGIHQVQSGVLYVFRGGTGIVGSLSETNALHAISAPLEGTEFGRLQPLLDVTGDGIADLAVYAPLAEHTAALNSGALYLFHGSSTFDAVIDQRIDGVDDEFLGGRDF